MSKIPYEVPRALGTEEVAGVVEEFRLAAENAKAAGFDGIEIHGANGYLIDIFLQSSSNTRTDRYGGSVENRFRIVDEILTAVSTVFPSNRIGIRFSPNGAFGSMGAADNFDSFSYYLAQLNRFNLAYVHVVDGLGFGFHNLCKPFKLADARKVYDGCIIGNCGYEKLTAEGAINTGAADLIAFGRPYIANPDLPARYLNNWPLAQSSHEIYWFYPNFPDGDPSFGYSDYPVYVPSAGEESK
jgi:N-ethylmaleimide reductase